MTSKLDIDPGVVRGCRDAAQRIAHHTGEVVGGKTTTSIERTVARLLGVEGADRFGVPLVNVLVDHVHQRGLLGRGIAHWVGIAIDSTGCSATEIATAVGATELDIVGVGCTDENRARAAVRGECESRLRAIDRRWDARRELREGLEQGRPPLRYVLTATGNVYEDVVHAHAVAEAGGDIVAVIRSTAQSLLDYVPEGPTVEGYGGTFATQANFRIMREALDEWSVANGRYVRLSSFCSGLCMPEIAAMGATEGFDNMVNDALYGILYRDINAVRTLIDQGFSRRINGHFGVVINTGEDNYLRTADALEAASSVVASQFINFYLALACGLRESQIALGNAFEVSPTVTNGLLFEWAQAQLTRELFPDCPVKYMPPTKHTDGNLFRTHACDTLFNLVATATRQGIQTIGVPTEGIHTPHIHDRALGLESAGYVARFARDLGDEIQFRSGGIVQRRAADVLHGALVLLEAIAETGLLAAISGGTFGDVSRAAAGGRGAEGIVDMDSDYFNPCAEVMAAGQHA